MKLCLLFKRRIHSRFIHGRLHTLAGLSLVWVIALAGTPIFGAPDNGSPSRPTGDRFNSPTSLVLLPALPDQSAEHAPLLKPSENMPVNGVVMSGPLSITSAGKESPIASKSQSRPPLQTSTLTEGFGVLDQDLNSTSAWTSGQSIETLVKEQKERSDNANAAANGFDPFSTLNLSLAGLAVMLITGGSYVYFWRVRKLARRRVVVSRPPPARALTRPLVIPPPARR